MNPLNRLAQNTRGSMYRLRGRGRTELGELGLASVTMVIQYAIIEDLKKQEERGRNKEKSAEHDTRL